MPEKLQHYSAFRIALVYATLASLWIYYSDSFIYSISEDVARLTYYQNLKGLFFVLASALIIYALIKTAFKRVENNKQFFKSIFDSANAGLVIAIPGQPLKANAAYKRLSGLDLEKVNERFIQKYVHPEDQTEMRAYIARTQAGDFSAPVNYHRFIHDNGTIRWLEIISSPFKLHENAVLYTVSDVTDLIVFQNELEERIAIFEQATKATENIIWVWNIEENTCWVSDQFYEHFDIPKSNSKDLMEVWGNYIHKEDKERVMNGLLKNSEKNETGFWTDGYRYLLPNGQVAHILNRGFVIKDEKGKPAKMIGAMIDQTKEIEYAEKLRASEEKYRLYFGQNPQPMWIYDPETLRFEDVNEMAITTYGYSREEFLSMTLYDLRPKSDWEEFGKTVSEIQGKSYFGKEWVHLKKNGEKITVHISGSPIELNGKKFRIVVSKDITEQKQAELRAMAALLEGENQERQRLARELHDGIGQTLSAASINLETAKPDILNSEITKKQQFESGLLQLKESIKELRFISKNLIPPTLRDFGLKTAIEQLVLQLRNTTDISIKLDSNLTENILTDKAKIHIYRVLQEALNNAIRHSSATEISLQIYMYSTYLDCSIEDNGVGADILSLQKANGSGLQNMKSRVELLGGNIHIEHSGSSGFFVHFRIPLNEEIKAKD